MTRRQPEARRRPRATAERPVNQWLRLATAVALVTLVAALAFKYRSRSAMAKLPAATTAAQPATAPPTNPAGVPRGLRVNPERAMNYVRAVVDFGPRPAGSAAHKKLEAYLRSQLKGVEVTEDVFTASTPAGSIVMRNFIAKFPGSRPGVIVLATHYDTLYGRNDFVGANDGGSGTGLLLEIANQLRGRQRNGYSVWLVWFDGEEAVRQWSPTDSLYGSRHLAEAWQKDGTTRQIKTLLLADMIGDADLDILRDQNSTPWLEDLVYQAATALGYQSHFFRQETAVDDDHLPFVRAGVFSADLIDFTYGYDNAYWHSRDDTLDKLSPQSLQITGDVMLQTLAMLDAK